MSADTILRVTTDREWDEATKLVSANELLGAVITAQEPVPYEDIVFPKNNVLIESGVITPRAAELALIACQNSVNSDTKLEVPVLGELVDAVNGGVDTNKYSFPHDDGIDEERFSSIVCHLTLTGSVDAYLKRQPSFDEEARVKAIIRKRKQMQRLIDLGLPKQIEGFTMAELHAGDMLAFSASGLRESGRLAVLHYFISTTLPRVSAALGDNDFIQNRDLEQAVDKPVIAIA